MIVGLGNPGAEYANTRHNAGAWFAEKIAAQSAVIFSDNKKLFGFSAQATIGSGSVRLLIPTTFMNLSGKAVLAAAQFYKLQAEEILVAHDELDLPAGCCRLKQGGGHGGHNGLRDIIKVFGGKKDFWRLRIGIDHPGEAAKVVKFVLAKPSSKERLILDQGIDQSLDVANLIVSGQMQKAMTQLHSA